MFFESATGKLFCFFFCFVPGNSEKFMSSPFIRIGKMWAPKENIHCAYVRSWKKCFPKLIVLWSSREACCDNERVRRRNGKITISSIHILSRFRKSDKEEFPFLPLNNRTDKGNEKGRRETGGCHGQRGQWSVIVSEHQRPGGIGRLETMQQKRKIFQTVTTLGIYKLHSLLFKITDNERIFRTPHGTTGRYRPPLREGTMRAGISSKLFMEEKLSKTSHGFDTATMRSLEFPVMISNELIGQSK